MAYGSRENKTVKYFSIKGLAKGSTELYFEVKDAKTGEIEQTEKPIDYVVGELTKIKFTDEEFEGKKFKSVSFSIVSGNELYLLKGRLSKITRDILNRLFKAKSFEDIEIRLRMTNKDGKYYPNVYIQSDDEGIEWLYNYDEMAKYLREVRDPETGEVIKTDFSKLDELFIEKTNSIIIPQLSSSKSKEKHETTKEKDILDDTTEGEDNIVTPENIAPEDLF